MTHVQALDISTGRRITGKLIKRYALGVTIDDAKDVRYYVTYERIIDGLPPEQPREPGTQGTLWQ